VAEIRSTMDIIMEKTKGLTMSEEEKKALKEQELQGKVRGLIQKLTDGALNLEQVAAEMASIAEKDRALAHEILRDEVLARIQPGDENESLVQILELVLGIDSAAVKAKIGEWNRVFLEKRGAREKELQRELEEKGIHGSAVVPNLGADPGWAEGKSKIGQRLKKELASLIER